MPFPAALKRGITLSRWWEDEQDHPLTSADLHSLHDMGIDFVQLPFSPTWLETGTSDQQKQKMDQFRCDVISIINEGLTLVIDMHASPSFQTALSQRPEEIIPHIEKLWTRMQTVLTDLPSWRIYLSLYSSPLTESVSWWRMQEKIIDDLRATFPANTFVASPGPFSGWWDLTDRSPYKDTNVIYGFHFYDPIVFTHHGEDTAQSINPAKPQSPIAYPVDKVFSFDMTDSATQQYVAQAWNRSSIATIIRGVAAWRDHYNANVVCLEFGVDRSHVDNKSRYNWLQDTRQSLEDMNIPWALWDYKGTFGLIDSQGIFDKGMSESLGLRSIKGP